MLQISLLVAADVNWIGRVRLLRVARDSDWPQTWKRLLNDGAPEIGRQATTMPRRDCCSGRSSRGAIRSLAACRSATGSPLIAGDSHLALTIPGAWLAAAYHSPSFNLAGMIPGDFVHGDRAQPVAVCLSLDGNIISPTKATI